MQRGFPGTPAGGHGGSCAPHRLSASASSLLVLSGGLLPGYGEPRMGEVRWVQSRPVLCSTQSIYLCPIWFQHKTVFVETKNLNIPGQEDKALWSSGL